MGIKTERLHVSLFVCFGKWTGLSNESASASHRSSDPCTDRFRGSGFEKADGPGVRRVP